MKIEFNGKIYEPGKEAKSLKPQHTPTPWQYNAAGKRDGSTLWANLYQENTHEIIATLNEGDKIANAAFIVRAVNCHEEMLNELKYLQTLSSGWAQYKRDSLAALIAVAEGK